VRTVVTAGHVDHGKSTLVRALTGMEPDRLAEEQRRGMSIELGFAWCDLTGDGEPVTVAFVDVPGHERFLATMLAGAGPAPQALFVVAADQGWQAQSQEHLDVLDLLGIPIVAAVVSRCGLSTPEEVAAMRADVAARLGPGRVTVPVIAVDALSGDGLEECRGVLYARLAAAPTPPTGGVLRLWLDRVFSLRGAGTIVTGTLLGDDLHRDADVLVVPSGHRARVRGLQSLGRSVAVAHPGDRVAVNLGGVDADRLHRGDVLVTAPPSRTTAEVDAVVDVLPGHEVAATGAWRLHVGTTSVPVRVRPTAGRRLPGGGRGGARLVLDRPLPLLVGDRFVLRDDGRGVTVAGGVVADPWPGPAPRGPARVEHAAALLAVAGAPPSEQAGALLRLGGGVVHAERVCGLVVPAGVVRVGHHLVDGPTRAAWGRAVRDTLAADGTADRTTLARVLVDCGCPEDAVDGVLGALEAAGLIARRGPAYVDVANQGAFDAATRRRREQVVERLNADPFAPPDLDEVVRAVGATPGDVQALLADKQILRHRTLAFSRSAIDRAVAILGGLEARSGAFTAGAAREALGTTRKYAIPLLELLDELGVTEFDGSTRRLRR
jgi:selenocysteine-specific elongation factor